MSEDVGSTFPSPSTSPGCPSANMEDTKLYHPRKLPASVPLIILSVVALGLGVAAALSWSRIKDRNVVVAQTQDHWNKSKEEVSGLQAQLGAANGKQVALEAQSEAGKEKLVELQTQLNDATSGKAGLEQQVEKAKAVMAELQTQFDETKAATVSLEEQAATAKASTLQLQKRLDTAETEATSLHAELDGAKAEAAALQAKLAKSEATIVALQPVSRKK